MILQRVRAGESRINPRLANGPLRAQSKAYSCYDMPSILRRVTYVSCRGYVGISQGHSVMAVNQGGTAEKYFSSLTEVEFCQGRFCFIYPSTELTENRRCFYEIFTQSRNSKGNR